MKTKSIRLMPFGDSITEGFTYDGAYRASLADMLSENGYAQYVDFVGVKNSGSGYDNAHSGFTSFAIRGFDGADAVIHEGRMGITELAEGVLDECRPDTVMLQIGTNDILSLYDLDNAGERLEALANIILERLPVNGMLFMATIPYMDASDNTYISAEHFTAESMHEYIDNYNARVRSVAEKKAAEGRNVRLADVNSVLSEADLQDGVHPTVSGYSKLGEFWYGIISAYINE